MSSPTGWIVPIDRLDSEASYQSYLEQEKGICLFDLFPSVRAAMDTALLHLASPSPINAAPPLLVNGLLDGVGHVNELVREAQLLVAQGCRTIKCKVGRRTLPEEDARALAALQAALPSHVTLRADANRLWTRQQADAFAAALDRLRVDLEYLEEPLQQNEQGLEAHVTNLLAYAAAWPHLPLALDETLDAWLAHERHDDGSLSTIHHDVASLAARLTPSIVALVLKPTLLGGPMRCRTLSCILSRHCPWLKIVYSSSFESHIGLAAMARWISEDEEACGMAHGLGTFTWFMKTGFGFDVTDAWREDGWRVDATKTRAALDAAATTLSLPIHASNSPRIESEQVETLLANGDAVSYHVSYKVWERSDMKDDAPTLLLLHGFLGDASDWDGIAAALISSGNLARCIAINLPGHASSHALPMTSELHDARYSIDAMRASITALVARHPTWTAHSLHLVGYSLGGRVALSIASHAAIDSLRVDRLVLVSSTPGLAEEEDRTARCEADDAAAQALLDALDVSVPLWKEAWRAWLQSWYDAPLWASLRARPSTLQRLLAKRVATDAPVVLLATCLASASPGRNPSQWDKLGALHDTTRVTWMVGELDAKFISIAVRAALRKGEVVQVDKVGHAMHVESPLLTAIGLLRALGCNNDD